MILLLLKVINSASTSHISEIFGMAYRCVWNSKFENSLQGMALTLLAAEGNIVLSRDIYGLEK
jgi:hypothetical protein